MKGLDEITVSITSNHSKNIGDRQAGNLAHNRRDFISCNVDKRLICKNNVYKSETLESGYENVFGDSIDAYNRKIRKDRIKYDRHSYFEHLFKQAPTGENAQVILTSNARGRHEIKSFNEELFQVGDCYEFGHFMRDKYGNFIDKNGNSVKWNKADNTYYDINGNAVTDSSNLKPNPKAETVKKILDIFYRGGRFKKVVDSNGLPSLERLDDDSTEEADITVIPFEERNPYFHVIEAIMHNDEWHGTPHIHIDYIAFGNDYIKGPKRQVGFERALANMGYTDKSTAYREWREKERQQLKDICICFGLETKSKEEEQLNNRGETIAPQIYAQASRDGIADGQAIKAQATQEAEEIIDDAIYDAIEKRDGIEYEIFSTEEAAKEQLDDISLDNMLLLNENKKLRAEKTVLDNYAIGIVNKANSDAKSITEGANTKANEIISNAEATAQAVTEQAGAENDVLIAENSKLTAENEQLHTDIKQNREQIAVQVNLIENTPRKKKFSSLLGGEKYEIDKSQYDEFMAWGEMVIRCSNNILTSDEVLHAQEEEEERLKQLNDEHELLIQQEAKRLADEINRKTVAELNKEKNDYENLLKKEKAYIKMYASRLLDEVSPSYRKMDQAVKNKLLSDTANKLGYTPRSQKGDSDCTFFLE